MPTPAPCLQGTKNIDLLFYAQDLELALQRANADKAARLLGWKAEIPIEQGIADALKWGKVRDTIIHY